MTTYYKVLYNFKIFKTNNKMLLNKIIRCYRFNYIHIYNPQAKCIKGR